MKELSKMIFKNRPLAQLGASMACLFLFYGCLETGIKNVSKLGTTTNTSITSDVDSFAISLAYLPTSSRVVQLQGVRNLASASLTIPCGGSGTACYCKFYQSTSDASPLTSSSVGISAGVNSFSCAIPGSTSTTLYKYVRLFNSGGDKATSYINIASTLTITDVIGALDKTKVRGIYRYSCNRTFLEGEGVSAAGVSCPAKQQLGTINAPYSFYLYSSNKASNNQPASNTGDKSSGMAFPALICNLQLQKTICATSPELRYGLYGESNTQFSVGISMNSIPDATTTSTATAVQVGFAALPDTAGNCPTGLIAIRPWVAQPQSITQGSLNGINPPSNFLNQSNALNDTQVEASQPSPQVVTRQANQTKCNDTSTNAAYPTGDCSKISFQGSTIVESNAFSQQSPVVCAIPPSLLSGVVP